MTTELLRRETPEKQCEIIDNVSHGMTISHIAYAHSAEKELTDSLMASSGTHLEQIQKLSKKVSILSEENGRLSTKAELAEQYLQKIIEQAQEIGRLCEKVAQLERRLQKDASDALTSGIANVG